MIMADSSGPQKNWYSILGACPTDGIQELKQKYQKLILMFHPDKQRPDISEGEAEQHIQRFIDVGQAWKILSNEESRKKYNLQLRENLTTPTPFWMIRVLCERRVQPTTWQGRRGVLGGGRMEGF
ncbi:dnaJ homolog subfamily C member 24-like isoform X3 [Carassius carassius]|uniref:dnaJ homolog subfamily C member 24-like isoform X3 n=1 Tax=Carassius carassius TaxID=217509 RepID=UPI00286843B1|nr:dnaJ homolog subfamily C member 24-like isoform X3 [Carassius carassius]